MYSKDDVTISGLSSNERWLESTLKAILYSKKISGIKNAQLISSIPFNHAEVKYIPCPVEINSVGDYNIFKIKYLYTFCPTNFLLTVHNDGFVINGDAWDNEFLNYDYIGALWPVGIHIPVVTHQDRCGNGGFSLRSKRFLEVAALYCPAYRYPNEDRVICGLHKDIFLQHGLKYAPDNIAARFSIEDTDIPEAIGQTHKDRFTLKSFGFHLKDSDAIKFLEDVKI